MSLTGILSIPGALFASKDCITEFTLSGVTSSVKKEEISIWVLFNAFLLIDYSSIFPSSVKVG